MKRKFSYSIGEMNRRLLAIGRPIRKYLVISTLSSIIGKRITVNIGPMVWAKKNSSVSISDTAMFITSPVSLPMR